MTPPVSPARPATSTEERAGFLTHGDLIAAVHRALEDREEPLAILLGGSHASGEAVWVNAGGDWRSLSDVDLYVLLPGRGRCARARRTLRTTRSAAQALLAERGLAAPLEIGFYTPEDLAALPARPASLALRARGRVLAGDPGWLGRIPAWTSADVSLEEIGLLIENRAFELLWALPGLACEDAIQRLLARHATLKTALDLSLADALLAGEPIEDARGRTERALARWPVDSRAEIALLWQRAHEWRAGEIDEPPRETALAEWFLVTRGWAEIWSRWAGRAIGDAGASRRERALNAARRARPRRRLRQALTFRARTGLGPGLASRLLHARAGTPEHRVNGSGALLVLEAAEGRASGALPPATREALRRLGVLSPADLGSFERAARAATRAWDTWILDGSRTREVPA